MNSTTKQELSSEARLRIWLRRPDVHFFVYCTSRLFVPLTVGPVMLLVATVVDGESSWIVAMLITLGLIACRVPSYIVEALGGAKERVAAAVYTWVYASIWALVMVAGILTDFAGDHSTKSMELANQMTTLAVLGVLMTLVAHVKAAAEAWVEPSYEYKPANTARGITRRRFEHVIRVQSQQVDSAWRTGGSWLLYGAAGVMSIGAVSAVFGETSDDPAVFVVYAAVLNCSAVVQYLRRKWLRKHIGAVRTRSLLQSAPI